MTVHLYLSNLLCYELNVIMQAIKCNEIIHISESVLRALTQNRITTILDFLQEDVTKLSAITKLNLPQILAVRCEIFKQYSAPTINGITLMVNSFGNNFLSTGLDSFDTMLDGGIPKGDITELCGLAGNGKTQLCFQLAINCVKNKENTVLFIDTKGDFSAVRIQKILDASGFSHKKMAVIMYRIRVVRVWTMEEIIDLLQSLKNKSIMIENLALIILDSLPCLMFQFLGDDNKIGLSMLNTLVNYSRFLCKELEISMICVNIQTRWVDQDVADLEDDGVASTATKEMYIEKRKRCLGKYWQNIPNLVLLLEKLQNNDGKGYEDVVISVMKCNNLKIRSKQCVLHISALGVVT